MITVNTIIDGIVSAMSKEFGSKYEIYTEDIEQGLKKPCFSVVCIQSSIQQKLGNTYFKKGLFAIYYFASPGAEARRECMNVKERLMDILELIEVDGDLLRGGNMEGEIVDGVLAFHVKYKTFVRRKEEKEPTMEKLKVRENAKKH